MEKHRANKIFFYLLPVTFLLVAINIAALTYLIRQMNHSNNLTTVPKTENTAVENTYKAGNLDASYKETLTTFFWIGESASDENGFINNYGSIWDGEWQTHFGGYDDPNERCGYKPCGFEPLENPFYFALPYNDLDEYGWPKDNARLIPWYRPVGFGESILKNTWIEMDYNGNKAYAQWQDVGPFDTDDVDFVFGGNEHKNKKGVGAGLDVSPAVRDYLQMPTNDLVKWRFIYAEDVPDGPWKDVVTTSDVNRYFLEKP